MSPRPGTANSWIKPQMVSGWQQLHILCAGFPDLKRLLGVSDRHRSLSKMSHCVPIHFQLHPFQRKMLCKQDGRLKGTGSRLIMRDTTCCSPLHTQSGLCAEPGFLRACFDQCVGGSGKPLILRLTQNSEKNRAHFQWLVWSNHAILCF